MSLEIKNARITSADIGDDDNIGHGMLSFEISLNYGDSVQCFGGWSIGHPKANYGAFVIRDILRVAGVGRWSEVAGRYVRAVIERDRVVGLRHILDDRVEFFPATTARQAEAAKESV